MKKKKTLIPRGKRVQYDHDRIFPGSPSIETMMGGAWNKFLAMDEKDTLWLDFNGIRITLKRAPK